MLLKKGPSKKQGRKNIQEEYKSPHVGALFLIMDCRISISVLFLEVWVGKLTFQY
jgi:hypothetical protein